MLMLIDELKIGETHGFRTTDFSREPSDPQSHFQLKTILLMLIGDYPGTGKVTRMHHSGFRACHWCWHRFDTISTGHQCAINNRQHLSFSDSFRTHYAFGEAEHAAPPAPRTHDEYVNIAKKIEEAIREGRSRTYVENERKRNGIIATSILVELSMFDIIWDVLPCFMHIDKGLWQKWIIPMSNGTLIERNQMPLQPSATHTVARQTVKYSAAEMLVRRAEWSRKFDAWQGVQEVLARYN